MPRSSPPRLADGHSYFGGLSFFQKSIREGRLEQALYWGHYLFRDNQSYATAAFRRMRMIAHEDIGLANLEAIVLIDELHRRWSAANWGNRDRDKWIAAVNYLCESPKNKENDWYLIIGQRMMQQAGGWAPSHPYLSDCIEDGDEEGAFHRAYEMESDNDERLWRLLSNLRDDQVIRACRNSYEECSDSLGADGFWSLSLLYLCRDIQFEEIDIDSRVQTMQERASFPIDIESFIPSIPDYYYDKHTYQGKNQGRGFVHWFDNCNPQPYEHTSHERHQMNHGLARIFEDHPVEQTQSQIEQAELDDFDE